MVPIGSLVKVSDSFGPDRVQHYNGYPVADINGAARPGSAPARPRPSWPNSPTESLPRGIEVRMDRPDLSEDPRRQHRLSHLPALHAARLPRAGRAVRKPAPAARHHPHRADVPAQRPRRRVADRRRQQHLHPDRPHRARRSGLQKRHPHRRVRPREADWRACRRRRPPSKPAACACARSS